MEKKGKKRKEKMTESEERIVKRLCDAIYYLFKKLKRFFLCVCFLSSAATNGEDGHGLPNFSVQVLTNAIPACSRITNN